MNRIQWKYQIIIRKTVVWRNFNFEGICVICLHMPDDKIWYLSYCKLLFRKLNTTLASNTIYRQRTVKEWSQDSRNPIFTRFLFFIDYTWLFFSSEVFSGAWVPTNRSSINSYIFFFFFLENSLSNQNAVTMFQGISLWLILGSLISEFKKQISSAVHFLLWEYDRCCQCYNSCSILFFEFGKE